MTNCVVLSKWRTDSRPIIDIDWPHYHKELGEECISWLWEHEQQGHCEMIIERQHSRTRLVCEFSSEKVFLEYVLKYAPDHVKTNL